MLLSDIKVQKAKPLDKAYKLKDGDGLFLLVHPNGSKYWRLRYFFAGKEKMLALGTYPEVSLLDARDKRLAARKLVAAGEDPGAKKKQDKRLAIYKANNTFEAIAKEWFDTNKPKWTPDHAARLWRRLELHMMPEIGRRPIADIQALDLLDVLRQVEKRGTTETSHRLLQTCNVIFRYAVLTGRIQYNPTQDLKGALTPHKAENHPTIQAKELPDFFRQLEQVDTAPLNKLAIRLLMLTFVRQGELRQAKWEDFDFKAKEWRLPPHTTKMKDLHIVPLAKQALELLEELKKLTGDFALVFGIGISQKRAYFYRNINIVNR